MLDNITCGLTPIGDVRKPKFKLRDIARTYTYKNILQRGYKANFMNEIFRTLKIFNGYPIMYKIEDTKGEEIIRKFYENAMTLNTKKDFDRLKEKRTREEIYAKQKYSKL